MRTKQPTNAETVAYVRVSTMKDSQKDSPEHQRMMCEEKAISLGLEISYTYKDRSSGTSIIKRTDIQKLLTDAKNGMFTTIIFRSLSRFSRDTLDSLTMKRSLVDALGIRLIAIDENYDSDIDKDEMKFQIHSMMAQMQAHAISLATKGGRRARAQKGNYTGAIPPFGCDIYKPIPEKRILKPNDKAWVVKKIFNLYVKEKKGEKAIVNVLNEEGILSSKGNLWQITSIQRILVNEAYTGQNVYNKYEIIEDYNDSNNMTDRRKVQVQRDKKMWNKNVEKNWEAIIDDETFQIAQNVRLNRGGGARGGQKSKVNVLRGMMFCSHCGASMTSGKSANGRKPAGTDREEYRHIFCSKRKRTGKMACDNNLYLDYYQFLDTIVETLSKRLQEEIDITEQLEKAKNKPIENNNKEIYNKERTRLEKEIDDNREYLSGVRQMKIKGEFDDDPEQYEYEKKKYQTQLTKASRDLEKLEVKEEIQKDNTIMIEDIKQALEDLVKLNFEDYDELRSVLQTLIDRIEITKGENREAIIDIYSILGKI